MKPIKATIIVLLIVHGFLVAWSLAGFIEWFWASPPWPGISNPLFPGEILFMQWLLILAAGLTFILGYLFRWRYTPIAMTCVYVAMAALCAVETFGYMESDSRFIAMGLEYLAYAGILAFLFKSRIFSPASFKSAAKPLSY